MTNQPTEPPTTSKKTPIKLLAIAGAVFALLLAAGVTYVVFDEDTPTDVAVDYFEAWNDLDRDALRAVVCADDWANLDMNLTRPGLAESSSTFTPTSERIVGEIAYVEGELVRTGPGETGNPESAVITVWLVDGEWRVCTRV